ncbi:eri-1 [Pristionchus pacificus]|nr:eri-1 [Pristionchus pacificus]
METHEVGETPLAKMNPREEHLLSDYYDKLMKISDDVERETAVGILANDDDVRRLHKPPENHLDTVLAGDSDKGIDPKKVERLFKRINEMTAAEMRIELKEIHKSPHGSKKELRFRLRHFYRKEFSLIQEKKDYTRARSNNRKRFKYLVAIDIEATCEAETNDINYPHETIELPAVLVECNNFTIIDRFRTYVRPEINPKISEFCSQLTHISQSDVDAAPLFPEAWARLVEWMSRWGMMGDDKDASFAIVTDGPNDVQHFLQRSFLQYNMNIPHEFRHFINVKKIFELRVERLSKGDGKTSIAKMCEKLNLEMEGTAHQGIMDAVNVAKIACALVLSKKLTLCINQRIVRQRNKPLRLPPPANEEEIRMLNEQLSQRRGGHQKPNSSNAAANRLPFALRNVLLEEFNTGAYWDCDTCDERDS